MIKQQSLKYIPRGRTFICQKLGFIWVANPKVASSAMRNYIITKGFENDINHLKDGNLRTSGKDSAISDFRATQFSDAELKKFFLTLPKICFVRNPYERFRSTYENKINRQIINEHLWYKKPKRQILETLGKNLKTSIKK